LSIPTEPIKLKVTISKPTAVAIGYSSALTIEPTSKTSTIAAVSLKNTNVQRAIDFINDLIAVYNIDTNTEKNEVAQKSADFIEERIGIINNELGTTENELAAFKQRAGLTDLSSDAQLALQESSKYEQQYAENATQINLVTYLRDYINNPDNNDEVIPANVGLSDVNLASAIEKYNNLVVERKRLLRTSSESNPAIINLNTGIEAMRHNVKTTVNSVLKGLQITRNNIDRQSRKYESRISNAPKQEQEFMTISRQQEIKATLYIMLLQKREENAITLAATANNGRIIEEPIPGGIVSPKGKLIYIIALVIGIGIPISIIYLLNLLRFRIEGHTDVEKLTTVPIIGDIPLTDAGKNGTPTIAVRENDNNIMAETFRSLRTNLLFIMGDPDKKVILVTSTISGEGKTFMASNLAVSLALLGKKVILVGLDIRKPGLNKIFHLSHKEKGITQYLAAPQSTDLHALIQPSGITSNLDLLLGGPIPPNPTELLARQSLEDTISTLRKEYDYIVLDTAPIGMVTDTLILSRVADASIYVCRADYTHKTDYQLINELQEHHRLPNLCTVVNGIDMKKKKYGYYYGYGKYGKYYGYGKKYGYS
jgi:tyrosine-protein kinase Etk/Wzc